MSWTFTSKSELKENNIRLHARNNQLTEEVQNLKKMLEDARKERDEAQHELRVQRMENIARATESAKSAVYFSKYINAQSENKVLRQILTDLTGKNPDEMIAAHEKAVRLLSYEEVEEDQKDE